jgi:hypothetical protein
MADLPPNYPHPHDKKISELPTGNVTQDCLVPLVGLVNGNLATIRGTLADVSNLAPVQTVHTRTGDVVGMAGDYNATLVGFDTAGRSIIQPTSTDVQLAVNDLDDEVGRLSLTQQMAGAYDALNNVMEHVTSAGANAGFVVGQDVPAAAPGIEAYYVVVSVEGSYNGTPMFVTDRLWCDGGQWIPIAGPRASTPVTSVHGRIGDIVGVSGDYSAGLVTAGNPYATVQAAIDDLAARVAALESRPYLLGGFNRSGNDGDGAWYSSGGATGNIGQLNRHSAHMATRSWGDHGVALSGNAINLTKTGNYLIHVRSQVGDSVSSEIVLDVDGQYSNAYLRNSYNQDAPADFHVWYRKTNTTTVEVRLNRFGGGAFDFWTPSTTITRFSL